MPQTDWHEDDSDDSPDPEGPDESDMDSSDEPELVPCPYCRKMIHEDTEICHLCGSYISAEDAPANTPRWISLGVVLCILILLSWVLGWLIW